MFRTELLTAMERDSSNVSLISNYQSDDLIEKLKLLNYENLLLKSMKMKPLSKYYFTKAKNSGEQFFLFVSICAWLIRETGKSFDPPQEFDDPNVVISKIIRSLSDMDIATDFQSNKLISGAGPICVYVLDCLASKVIKVSTVQIQKPQIKIEENSSLDIIENDSEIILEKLDEQNIIESESDDERERNSIYDLNHLERKRRSNKDPVKVDSLADNENFRLEMERVLPQLKIVVKSDNRDWRTHFEQIKSLRNNIEQVSDDAQNQLRKMQNEIVFAMEKIESREKHLNRDLKDLINEYKTLSIEHTRVNNEIKRNDKEKSEMEESRARLTNDLENVKIQMEQRGNSMSDGSPLINIKKAVVRLKEEIAEMDVKIGVMQHTMTNDVIRKQNHYAEFDLGTSNAA
ncbi:CLUMA_CG020607, isoform A [Clunio marinus]|uniref:CLUMA_CG020607, isoform A n=1 Tax=Clunio marinus TaxID=568069 RepID=A0A1J1J5F8_9DIPT|nr:CLUMA_CG020607, isoform A [Clunio marinus]